MAGQCFVGFATVNPFVGPARGADSGFDFLHHPEGESGLPSARVLADGASEAKFGQFAVKFRNGGRRHSSRDQPIGVAGKQWNRSRQGSEPLGAGMGRAFIGNSDYSARRQSVNSKRNASERSMSCSGMLGDWRRASRWPPAHDCSPALGRAAAADVGRLGFAGRGKHDGASEVHAPSPGRRDFKIGAGRPISIARSWEKRYSRWRIQI